MQYVGQTIRALSKRWKGHYGAAGRSSGCPFLGRAIIKYGREAFDVETLDWATTKEELNAKEIYWISALGTMAPNGYNLHRGGRSNGPTYPNVVARQVARMSAPDYVNPSKGKKMTPKQIQRLRVAKTGKIVLAKRRPVWCVETGQCFSGLQEAARWVESSSSLRFPSGEVGIRVARDKPDRTSGGYHWKSTPDNETMVKLSGRRHKSPIICVETGVEYTSIIEAQREMETTSNKKGAIRSAVLRGDRAFGYHWCYVSNKKQVDNSS